MDLNGTIMIPLGRMRNRVDNSSYPYRPLPVIQEVVVDEWNDKATECNHESSNTTARFQVAPLCLVLCILCCCLNFGISRFHIPGTNRSLYDLWTDSDRTNLKRPNQYPGFKNVHRQLPVNKEIINFPLAVAQIDKAHPTRAITSGRDCRKEVNGHESRKIEIGDAVCHFICK